MAELVKVKGTTRAGGDTGPTSVVSTALDGAYLLFTQDDFNYAPSNYRVYMARWLFLDGGRYIMKAWAEDEADIIINEEKRYHVGYGREYKFEINLEHGGSLFQMCIASHVEGSPAFVAFAIYKDGSPTPEYRTNPDGWQAMMEGYPDVGDNPYDNNAMYPVWPLEPTWGDPITETIEWLTNVLISESGAEQRRKLRTYPRRSFTASFVEWKLGQRMLDAAATALNGGDIIVPIYWDKQALHTEAMEGTNVIHGDFSGRWEFAPGRVAVLKNQQNMIDNEAVLIKAVTDNAIITAKDLKRSWPVGTLLYPAAPARINNIDSIERPVNDAALTKITFEITEPFKVEKKLNYMEVNDKNNKMVLYGLKHNWGESVTIDLSRDVVIHDNAVGRTMTTDVGKNSISMQRTSLFIQGIDGHRAFLEMLFAAEGQMMTFHLVTQQEDIRPVKDIVHEEGYIACEPIGYTAFGTVSQQIRTWLVIQKTDGTRLYAKAISTRIAGNVEYIVLEHSVGTIPLQDILMICWCPISRLGSDSVDIEHKTDIEGLSTSVLVFKSFYDRRRLS